MRRIVHTVALTAALVAVALGVWRESGLLVTLQRATISYLSFFFLLSGLMLAVRLVEPAPPVAEPESPRRRRGPLGPAPDRETRADTAEENAGTERADSVTR